MAVQQSTLHVIRPHDPDQPHTYTVSELIRRYQREYLSTKALTTQKCQASILKRIQQDFGSWALADVSPESLRTWRDKLAKRYSPGTVRRYLHTFGGLFTVAVRDLEWANTNPLRKVKPPAEPPGRERYLTEEESAALLTACQASRSEPLYLFVLLALSTGCRKMELLSLRWSGVDLASGTLRLARTKNGSSRAVPLTGLGLRMLKEHAERTAHSGFVIPGRGAGCRNLDHAFRVALKRAGLRNCRIHDLRHTFASQVAMSGASTNEVAALLGHRQLKMAMKYSHFSPSHLSSVAAKMTLKFLGE